MPLRLLQLDANPNEIAVTKVDSFVPDGTFLLDFSRRMERLRWLGVLNSRVGLTVALVVPVIHQAERDGGYVIGVHRSDPYFAQLPPLWKARYPSKRAPPNTVADPFKIVTDFAEQFPDDSR
jgi:hypothetical protein